MDESTNWTYDTYRESRLERAIEHYGKKAKNYRRCYHSLAVLCAICTAIIPVSSSLELSKYIVIVLGIVNAIFIGILSIYKCNEKWILYRTTVGKIKQQKFFYLAGADAYKNKDDADKLKLLVENVEKILNDKNFVWAETVSHHE